MTLIMMTSLVARAAAIAKIALMKKNNKQGQIGVKMELKHGSSLISYLIILQVRVFEYFRPFHIQS